MAQHTTVQQIETGEWAVVGKRGSVIATYATECAARRAIADDKTPAERAAAFGDTTIASTRGPTYEAELVRRLDAGLPLSKSDAKLARRLRRSAVS